MVKYLHIQKHFFLAYWLCACAILHAQYYTLDHFDIDNGLPSNTVYKMLQDKDGYLWIGTISGLCRYDGLKFKTYSNQQIFAEDMPWIYQYNGRVWGLTWSGKLGYIQQDSLYIQTFKEMNSDSVPRYFLADRYGGYWIKIRNSQVMHYHPDGGLERLKFENHQLYQDVDGNIYGYGGGFSFYNPHLRKFSNLKKIEPSRDYFHDYYMDDDVLWSQDDQYCYIHKGHQLDKVKFRIPLMDAFYGGKIPIRQVIKDKKGSYWTHNGISIRLYDADGNLKDDITAHLKKKDMEINMLFVDREYNLWICTQGNGLYLLKNWNILNYSVSDEDYISQLSGSPDGSVLMTHQSGKLSLIDKTGQQHSFLIPDASGGVFYGIHFYQGNFYGMINRKFFELSTHPVKLKVFPLNWAAKNIGLDSTGCFSGGYIVVGHWVYALLRDSEKNCWLGTNKGVYIIPGPKTEWPCSSREHFIRYRIKRNADGKWIPDQQPDTVDIGKVIVHSNRGSNTYVSQITQDHTGTVWIASQCEGVWAYKNGKVRSFNQSNGLCSNNINSIYADEKNRMWISTNAGVSCILSNGEINNITTEDGILSNQVNGVYLYHDSILYVGTSKGLSVIDISQRQDYLPAVPVIKTVKLGNQTFKDFRHLSADYWQNDLWVEYISVSFTGKVKYKYLIEGLTNKWQVTENRSIHIPKLPSGNYHLKIKALNQNGIESKDMAVISFSIAIPFWQTKAFWIIVIAIFFSILFLISLYTNGRKIKSLQLKKRMDELERKALLSQINPHFIFNSLSAIKYLVATGEVEKADEYLQKFAVLMRTTLDFSESKWISLEEELNYISNYLALEKLRFNQFFDYEINVHESIKSSYVQLPPMLLQPFIENAIRHGIRPKKNGKGYLIVSFIGDASGVTIIIDDNGIGFKTSLGLKIKDEIHYQSKGMNLSKQRAALQGIDVNVIHKENSENESEGTQVILKIRNRA